MSSVVTFRASPARDGFWSARPINRTILILITVFVGASVVSDMILGNWAAGERAANVLMTLLTGIPFFLLWIRSTVAFAALVPALIASHVFALYVSTSLFLPAMLLLVASTATLSFSLTASGVSALWAVLMPISSPENANTLWVVVPLIVGGWLLGHFLQQSMERRERDLRRVAEATRRAAEAAQEERRLLARDLHDIVAHNLTIIAMQTRTAEYVGTEEAARQAVRVAAESAKEALSDLRRMLTLLQAEGLVADGATEQSDAQDGASALDLEHGAVRFGRGLEALGISTAVNTEGLSTDIPQSVETAVYRVLQEAVTNVAKHAGGGSEAVITVQVDDDEVRLAVGNRITGTPPRDKSAWMSSGHGLVGMRDRVAAFEGTFDAGRQKDWWWVRAEVPLAAPN